MRSQERTLKGAFGVNPSVVEFGRRQRFWMRRNFVKAASISLKVSFRLREVIGNQHVYSESQAISKVWTYIKQKNLADLSDDRSVIPDRKLSKIVGKKGKKFSKSKIAAAIKKHIRKSNFHFKN